MSTPGTKADPVRDRITVDGRLARPTKLRYVMLHKPVGVVSTMSDPEGRPALGEVVRDLRDHLFPVGRLDYESSGLVLLTNDGELAQRLTHPRYGVEKTYRVKVKGKPSADGLERLRRGLRLADGPTLPCRVDLERDLDHKTRLRVSIREGRQRQVRRMFEAIGCPVDRLSRVSIGPLRLGALPVGALRDLTPREVTALRAITRSSSAAPRTSPASSRSAPRTRRDPRPRA